MTGLVPHWLRTAYLQITGEEEKHDDNAALCPNKLEPEDQEQSTPLPEKATQFLELAKKLNYN